MPSLYRLLITVALLFSANASQAGLIWDTVLTISGGVTGFIKTDNGTVNQNGVKTFNITSFGTLTSGSSDIPVYHDWEMLGEGSISIYPPMYGTPVQYNFHIPTLKAPIDITTEVYGTEVTISETQWLGINPTFSFAKTPNSEGWISISDNVYRPWQQCADEWANSIELGYINPETSCINNGGIGNGIGIHWFNLLINTNPTKVPEPSSLALIIFGIAAISATRLKKAQKRLS
jgi:hypothetical protein